MNGILTQSRYPTSLDSVRRDLDRWFEHFFNPADAANGGGAQTWRAPAALWEDNDNFHLEVEVPGVRQDDLDITYEKGALTVAATRGQPADERKVWHDNRRYGKLQFSLRLPEIVDGEKIEAELAHGILHLSFAKRPEAQPKKITVKSAE